MISNLISAKGLIRADQNSASPLVQKNLKNFLRTTIRLIAVISCCAALFGCPSLFKKESIVEAPPPQKKASPIEPQSAKPIIPAPKDMVTYAQTALKKLGYKVGAVDGVWGPRSAKAMRAFEARAKIWSANGHISQLNLEFLRRASGLNKDAEPKPKQEEQEPQDPQIGITAKLDQSVTLESGPQLIIVDREYNVFSKPNPYSATLTKLQAGTGIYIVARESDWYEIESLDRLKGYIEVD